ncbi:MAG: hypothetical protein JJE22_11535, partial [Bacteroidia bacterium]|nr:hypothetical protein [Bacteroidia bacterium]
MTPELKSACELVFLEHKTSARSINWNRDAFHGRISFGLSEMAKETLVSKNIIYLPNPANKKITLLNPVVASAATFEEAEDLIQKRVPSLATSKVSAQPAYITNHTRRNGKHNDYMLLKIRGKHEITIAEKKWYTKPLFYYFVLPAGAAVGGAL